MMTDIKKLFVEKDYEGIYDIRYEIIKSDDCLDITSLIISAFYLEETHLAMQLFDMLYLKEYASYQVISYGLLSLMHLGDYYKALALTKKYELLKQPEMKIYRDVDGANYTNLLKESDDVQFAMIICLFLETNKELIMRCLDEDCFVELGVQYFDLINNLYELGYSRKIIKELTESGHTIYQI